jgi:hypothetical protein
MDQSPPDRLPRLPLRVSPRVALGAVVAVAAVFAVIDLARHPALGTPRHAFVDAVAVVGLSVLAGLIGLRVVRRLAPHHVLAPHNDVAGFVYATIGVTYAVVLGFVLVTVWDQFGEAGDAADREADAAADLARLAAWFPASDRQAVVEAVRAYADAVVAEEWPAMANETAPSEQAAARLDALWNAYRQAGQGAIVETAPYAEGLARLDELTNARRERLLASRAGLPGVMAAVLVVGGVLTVGFAYAFGVERAPSHALMIAALAATLGLLLFLTFELNHPFRGDVHVRPEGLEVVLDQLTRSGEAPA